MLLPLTVLWSSVRLPVVSERIAPPRPTEPVAVVLPPVSVSPPRVKSPVVAVMLKIRESWLALIVTFAASGRASITSAWLIASSVPPSVIVAPESAAANVISSAPAVAFAAWIASRSEMPSAPGVPINAAIEVTLPLTTSFVLPTVTLASSRRSSSGSKRSRRRKGNEPDSWPLRARTTQLADRPDPLMAQPARHVSASMDEEKMLGPVYHPVSRRSKKNRSIRPDSAEKPQFRHFDVVNIVVRRVATSLFDAFQERLVSQHESL